MAQGLDESSTLLTRIKVLWDELDDSVKQYLHIGVDTDNTKAISFTNGSSIFVRTSFRSTTLQRLHISEMGKIANKTPEKAKETKSGTLQAIAPGNTVVIESTAEGDNMFKDMWDQAIKHYGDLSDRDFSPVFLSWIDDPDCVEPRPQIISDKQAKYFAEVEKELGRPLTDQQKWFWVTKYRELFDDIFQEYPSTPVEAFMANKEGAYYAKLYLHWVKGYKREVENLYDPNLDVQIAIDLGVNDTNVITVFQEYTDGIRIIDEIYDSGQPISYYIEILENKPYANLIWHIILPHDGEVMELIAGKTRREVFEENFPHATVTVLPRLSVNEGIEMVRQVLKRLWIDPKCQYLISCLFNYTKEWDEKRNRWRDKPEHNEFSNGADSIRYMAMGSKTRVKAKRQRRPNGGHDV